uniref:SBP-type domain-containing protein n=1 Tax=Tetradesmus obliquus TaxID=3088 RepID=A0A383WI73_TETOB|eukprot:jgi/Sobl393_1/8306/SZX76943.1
MRYNLKKRLCPQHLKADAVQVEGCGQQLFRFCQQCGKLEDLARFAGARRSCRPSLLKRRTLSEAASGDQELACVQQQRRQRRHSSRRADSTAAADASTPDMPDMPAAPEADLEVVAAPSDAQLLELSRAVSADDAAAALADAWCSVGCSDSDYEHFPSCSALPASPMSAAAAAAGSSSDSDSFLSSLVQMEISKALAGSPLMRSSSSNCSAAASFAASPQLCGYTSSLLEGYAAEPSSEQLEVMIEQELLAAGMLAAPAAFTQVPAPAPAQQHLLCPQQEVPVHVMLPGMAPAAAPAGYAYGLPIGVQCIVPPPAAAAAAALPGSAQAGARLQRLRVQFEMLQHTMEALQELQAQTRELATAELSWAASEDAMHGVCYY